MKDRPDDLDAARAAVARDELVATASAYLTGDVAMRIDFTDLAEFKDLLKRFFSPMPWGYDDETALDRIVGRHLDQGEWWEHDLGSGVTMAHGLSEGTYRLWVTGAGGSAESIFDRAFEGPVTPEATPHPRKVKFTFGGTPTPGTWYRRTDPDRPGDERVSRLLMEPDVTDVMVAGDFVTIGLAAKSPWETRLEPLLSLVTELFADAGGSETEAVRTREELIREAAHIDAATATGELHMLDPDDPTGRANLEAALDHPDPRARRVAVAVLAESADAGVRTKAVTRGYADSSRTVRRTAVDAAADAEDPLLRTFFTAALADADSWIRWRAVRALGEIGLGPSRDAVSALADDEEFRVRFEVERVLRGSVGPDVT